MGIQYRKGGISPGLCQIDFAGEVSYRDAATPPLWFSAIDIGLTGSAAKARDLGRALVLCSVFLKAPPYGGRSRPRWSRCLLAKIRQKFWIARIGRCSRIASLVIRASPVSFGSNWTERTPG